MLVTIQPSTITGHIVSPTSKSSMQRACAAALLTGGRTIIQNPGKSNDDLAALEVITSLGAKIVEQSAEELVIESSGLTSDNTSSSRTINCGESGLGIRMFAPIAALSSAPVTINGSGSLLTRPMDFFDEVFPQLDIQIHSNNGKLPITLHGPLQPKDITIDGSLSSQFLTGLLIAYGKTAKKPVTITVSNLKSRPYIDLTLSVMKHFGWEVNNDAYERFTIQPGPGIVNASNGTPESDITYRVEGDWSGAAFLLVAGAVAGKITIEGLDVFSTQADKAILQALMQSEAVMSIEEKVITIGPGKLTAFHFNATDCPDLFPPLVALAAYCEGTTVIEGVSRLAHKESNRGLTLQNEFGKMGIEIILQDDLMLIKGGTGLNGAIVHSNHDHRIAMACAVAALKADGATTIEEAEAINKSYPNFYKDLSILGATVSQPVSNSIK
ncbi:MAG: 3-phosphoshikimate 1-carboxyvinyltransferase [Ferruginibacter sp.]|nr:3-phosphoshikimate 1-carboxyvinyltransferase [Ferruginibacter sp.]